MTSIDEIKMIRDVARNFARTQLAPKAAEWDRTATFPADTLRAMGKLGFLGMLVGQEWDGPGLSHQAYATALEELAAGDASCTTVVSVQTLVNGIIEKFGATEHKERYLRPLARGEMISCFCLTEPHAGSDAANLKTRARKAGDEWVIDGAKQFISNGSHAEIALVFAVTDPEVKRGRGITAFLVPTDTPGFSVLRTENKMGQKASDAAQIQFDAVRIPDALRIGELGAGYKIALALLECGRIGIAAQSIGLARAAYEAALAYSKERETFGKPISQHQAVTFRLADMATQIEAARQLTLHAAAIRDLGQRCIKEACMAKLFATEMAERVCYEAIQIHGGVGYTNDFPVERLYRDVRITTIYEGTSDIQRMLIGREILSE